MSRYTNNFKKMDDLQVYLQGKTAGVEYEKILSDFRGCRRASKSLARMLVLNVLRGDPRFFDLGDKLRVRTRTEIDNLLNEERFIVLDLETTGIGINRQRITEIGAIQFDYGVSGEQFHTLIKPGIPLPLRVKKLTGITDEMLEGALKISDVLKQFQDFIGDRILVAHNAPFDLGFIELALQRNNLPPISNQILCTVRLAHWLMPERDKFRLDDLAALYNVSIKDRHRSIGDAEATVEVLRGLLTHYATQNQASLNL